MTKAIRNERRKLTATYINGLAVAILAIGGFVKSLPLLKPKLLRSELPSWW